MPHLVGDQLTVRVLHHVADAGALISEGQPVHRRAAQSDLAGAGTVGSDGRFQLLQEGGLAAAALAAEEAEGAGGDGEGHVVDGVPVTAGITEGHLFPLYPTHALSPSVV